MSSSAGQMYLRMALRKQELNCAICYQIKLGIGKNSAVQEEAEILSITSYVLLGS
jgi:hypothetical protein